MPFKPIRLGKGMIATVGAAIALFFCSGVGAQTPVKWTIEKSAGGTIKSEPTGGLDECAGKEPKCTATASYDTDKKVVLTATPALGFRFNGWGNVGCTNNGPQDTCELVAEKDKTIKVDFVAVSEWTIEKSAGGTIKSAPAGGLDECAGKEPKCTATASYDTDKEVVFTAEPAPGFEFSGWGTDFSCTERNTTAVGVSTCKFIPTTAKSVRVDFIPIAGLTVNVSGNGFVTSTPAGIDCTAGSRSGCNFVFERNTKVTLKAKPHGNERVRWNNATCSGDTCEVTMDSAKTVGVEFVGISGYIEIIGEGTIVISGSGRTTSCAKPRDKNEAAESVWTRCALDVGEWLRLGSTITLTAIPDPGYTFQGWGGGTCMGNESPCQVTLKPNDVTIISATFTGATSYPLYINKIGNGKVTSIPTGIDCGKYCDATYPDGTTVTLTAEIAPGSHFAWGGACSAFNTPGNTSNKSVCTIEMDQAQSVTAAFTITPSITIHKNKTIENEKDEEGGHITSSPPGIHCGTACTAEYQPGQTVTLQALPAFGYRFDGWGRFGQCAGYGPDTCILSVKTAETVNVTFTKEVCESRAFSPQEDRMIDMYIAYYGRPPYADGLRHWVTERLPAAGGDFNAIMEAFVQSEEYNRRFGGLSHAALVGRLYEYILGRTAETKGLNDYTNLLNAGRETIGSIAIQMLNNVTSGTPDVAALNHRRKVARHLVTKTEEGRSDLTDVALAAIMKNITDNPASADAACAELSNTIYWKQR